MPRRMRMRPSPEQTEELRRVYNVNPHPTTDERQALAERIGMCAVFSISGSSGHVSLYYTGVTKALQTGFKINGALLKKERKTK